MSSQNDYSSIYITRVIEPDQTGSPKIVEVVERGLPGATGPEGPEGPEGPPGEDGGGGGGGAFEDFGTTEFTRDCGAAYRLAFIPLYALPGWDEDSERALAGDPEAPFPVQARRGEVYIRVWSIMSGVNDMSGEQGENGPTETRLLDVTLTTYYGMLTCAGTITHPHDGYNADGNRVNVQIVDSPYDEGPERKYLEVSSTAIYPPTSMTVEYKVHVRAQIAGEIWYYTAA